MRDNDDRPADKDDESLKGLLHRGDPAADGREPSPEEFAEMRRRVMEAAGAGDAPTASGRWTGALAAVAATIVVLLVAFGLLRSEGPTGVDGADRRVGDAPAAESIPEEGRSDRPGAGSEDPTAGSTEQGPGTGSAITPVYPAPSLPDPSVAASVEPETEPGTPAKTAPAAVDAGPVPGKKSRTVHFTTPGGTRIVWVLDPELDLNLEGPPPAGQGVEP